MEVNTLNECMVGVNGEKITIGRHIREMTHAQALVLAAYLVSLVGDDERWEETLRAVQNS